MHAKLKMIVKTKTTIDIVTISMTVIDDRWNISFSQSFKVKVTRMSSKVVFGGVSRKKKGRQNLSSFPNK